MLKTTQSNHPQQAQRITHLSASLPLLSDGDETLRFSSHSSEVNVVWADAHGSKLQDIAKQSYFGKTNTSM